MPSTHSIHAAWPPWNRDRTCRTPSFNAERRERLRDLIQQHPRDYDQPTSQWTLERVAAVAYAEGMTPRQVSGETIRYALRQLGVNWKRAKHWIHSPDPAYAQKKVP
jgi:hypothetical protein